MDVAENEGRLGPEGEPLVILSGPGASPQLLAEALRGAGESVTGRLVVLAQGETPGALGEALDRTRLIFLAASAQEEVPSELATLDAERWLRVDLDRLLADPRGELLPVCQFAGIRYDQRLLTPLEEARRRQQDQEAGEGLIAGAAASPFASVSTSPFAEAVRATGGSLLVSTYQTHRLVCVRATEQELNTHFRAFEKPMGIAVSDGRMARGDAHRGVGLPRRAGRNRPA